MLFQSKSAVTVVTQVLVDAEDPAFGKPSKPIGSFFGEDRVDRVRREHPDWTLVSDARRDYHYLRGALFLLSAFLVLKSAAGPEAPPS